MKFDSGTLRSLVIATGSLHSRPLAEAALQQAKLLESRVHCHGLTLRQNGAVVPAARVKSPTSAPTQ